jgi:hypothetical protein
MSPAGIKIIPILSTGTAARTNIITPHKSHAFTLKRNSTIVPETLCTRAIRNIPLIIIFEVLSSFSIRILLYVLLKGRKFLIKP